MRQRYPDAAPSTQLVILHEPRRNQHHLRCFDCDRPTLINTVQRSQARPASTGKYRRMIDLIPQVAPLADQFNRPITYLRVSVTDRCNLRCVYCMPEAGLPWVGKTEILTFEEITSIVRAAAAIGVRSIRLTGGEPLVRRDLPQLVALIASVPGIDDIALSTNGLLLAPQIDELRAAGLRRVNISLDTLCPERFLAIARRPGLDRVLAGIDAALAVGLAPIKLNCVVMRGQNDDELIAFAELTRNRRVHVRFIEMMPVLDNVLLQRDAYVSAAEILDRIRARDTLVPIPGPVGNGPGALFCVPRGRRCGRRHLSAIARLLRNMQSPTSLSRRSAALMLVRR